MTLRVLNLDDTVTEIEGVTRLFTRKFKDGHESVYYEIPSDEEGKGREIRLDTIKCWEVVMAVRGGNLKL